MASDVREVFDCLAAKRHKCLLSMLGDVSVEGVETDCLQRLALIKANPLEP